MAEHGSTTRRDMLRLGLLALPAAALLRGSAAAQDFVDVPIVPDAARTDPLHAFWERIPDEFPLDANTRHFNTAGLGIAPLAVLERTHAAAVRAATEGDPMRGRLDEARMRLGQYLHARPEEIALVRNATEAMNIVARGLEVRPGDEIVLTTHEHPGGAAPWVALHQDAGVTLRLVEPQLDPAADLESIWAQVNKRTRAIVLSHVLCTVGAVMPVEAVAAEARRRGIWCIVDGAQAAGVLPLDLEALGADCYLASGHKWLLGPVETGFLWVRQERLAELRTRFAGVHSVDAAGWDLDAGRLDFLTVASRYEYGTRSPSQPAGLVAALDWVEALGPALVRTRSLALAQRFRAGIEGLPGIEVLTPPAAVQQVPIVTFRVTRRPNAQVVDWLWTELRMRLRLVPDRGLNGVRASFHVVNRVPDVDWLIEAVRTLGA